MTVQFIHCSDLHLDKNFNIPDIVRSYERKEDLNRNFSAIVNYAIANRPDLFLISGDIFDKLLPSNFSRVLVTRLIRELDDSNISVFMIGGNHDVPRMSEYAQLAIDVLGSAGLATVFSGSERIQKKLLRMDGSTICVSGKSYYARYEGKNPLEGEKVPLDGHRNILMLHGSLAGLGVTPVIPEMSNQNPFGPKDIRKGLNYLALGHYHNSFKREHDGCLICNPGSIEKLSWAEMNDEKGFYWVELNEREASSEFIKLDTRPMEAHELPLSKSFGEKLNEAVEDFLRKHRDEKKMLKLSLTGNVSQIQYAKMKLNDIYRACNEMFFHLVLDRSQLEVEGVGRIFLGRIENPIEAFVGRLDKMISETSDPAITGLLLEVRELGLKYLEAER